MGESTTAVKKKHPWGFYVCNLTFTFERLAYYGAKPILLLFLIKAVGEGGLGIDNAQAAVIAANLTAYTYLAPIIGGYISDRWLGARYAIPLGSVIMAIGYLIGWKAANAAMVNLMVIVISIGTGFFKGNLSAIQGRMYDDKSMLDSAFSIQYSFVNIGSFVGSVATGYLYLNTFKNGDVLGFRQCFFLSAVFCLIAAVWFVANWKSLQGQGKKPFKYLTDTQGNIIGEDSKKDKKKEKSAEPLTRAEKRRVWAIILVSAFSIIFWLFYYQNELALTIYMTEYVDMHLAGIEIAPGWINTSLNGLLCVALGGVMAAVWRKLSERPQGDLNMFQKIGLSFLFLGCAFGVVVLAEFTRGVGSPAGNKVSVLWMVGFVFLLTIGEMCFSPLRNAFVSKYAPKKYLSLLMGVITVATFCASKLSPYVQVIIENMNIFPVLVAIFILLLLCALFMVATNKKLNKLVEDED
ncbi:peptide MFS transporter [Lachnospiraceae bacterium KGMB03038]|nr:peptide MFS transporter [Lachnospiraceae bacterium KGMB03038]